MVNVKIKELLESDDINISWLSEKTGLSYSSLHKLVNNQTTSISFDSIYKICKALQCDISDILELKD